MRIKDIMSHPAVTCPEESCLDQAARLMWEFDCGIIPLVAGNGHLAGVITDRDICMAALTQGKPLHQIPVSSAMAKQVASCRADDRVESVEEMMRESQVRRVPVLDADGYVVGVIALNDLARLAAHAKKGSLDREFVQTMAAVCEPRARSLPISAPAVTHAGAAA